MRTAASTYRLLHGLFLVSGVAGLGYQVIWIRMFALGLGQEMTAVLAVVAAFFMGFSLGAWKFRPQVLRSRRPGLWYAVLEVMLGSWALLTLILIPLLNRAAISLMGVEPSAVWQWMVSFALPGLGLLPATAAMGATFPAMEAFARRFSPDGRCVGSLYSVNTLGAVAGTLVAAMLLAPWLGLDGAIVGLALVNFGCAGLVIRLEGRTGMTGVLPLGEMTSMAKRMSPFRVRVALFVTGLLGIGLEVVGVRLLSEVLENTVLTFALVLAVFLTGLAVGAALERRFVQRKALEQRFEVLVTGMAVACLVVRLSLDRMGSLAGWLRQTLSDHWMGIAVVEASVALFLFALPTVLMGALFSLLAQVDRENEGGVGRALALNTLGGTLAPLLFGVLVFPALGARGVLVVLACGYALLLVPAWRRVALAAGFPLILALLPEPELLRLQPGERLVVRSQGAVESVAVVATLDGHRLLRVNNRFTMGGTAPASAQRLHVDLPVLLHPAPRRVLFLGVGTGISFGALAKYPDLVADGAELSSEVASMLAQFSPENEFERWGGRLRLVVADARRFVRSGGEPYDVIVADLFHPARDGAGALYTMEHFRAIRGRLTPGGLFCQWLPLYQLDEATLRIVCRTFIEVFPDARAWLLRPNLDTPVLGLVGTLKPRRYPADWFARRVGEPGLRESLRTAGLGDTLSLLGRTVMGPVALARYAGNARINVDRHPLWSLTAPSTSTSLGPFPYSHLMELIALEGSEMASLLSDGVEAEGMAPRLRAVIAARDAYLLGLRAEREGREGEALERFISSAELSPDFTTGYAHCLTLAASRADSDPAGAWALLNRLIAARPEVRVAGELRRRLFGE